ncbi:hypothetical protein niasHT_003795 [Heterodera trifolii]|uniref:inositol-polyphosphate 5-phosphatase n=1 Tax=Heterodera trifolii TaxID=157864 RepID=A0ABD2LUU1_9BILA
MESCEFQCSELQTQRILLITSNVGSLFAENSSEMRNYWLGQILAIVNQKKPIFFALHLQESGGKNYRQHSREMPELVDELQNKMTALDFNFSRCFLDIDFELALSSLFFVHRSAVDYTFLYNFQCQKFCTIAQKNGIIVNGLNKNGFIRKEKFSHCFWPSFRWARKGFLHTRWKIGSRVFDFINIHLFHDESNLNFTENPNEYSANRQKALEQTLHRFEGFNGGTLEGESNCFLFGDFNFRLNLGSFVKKLTGQASEREVVIAGADKESVARGHSVSDSSSCGGNASPAVRTDDSEDSGLARTTHSTSSSESEEIRSSSYEDLKQKAEETDTLKMVRRKSSVIEYFRPIARDSLSPNDDPHKTDTDWVLRIGKKRFEYCDPNWLIGEWRAYREDDCEPKMYQLRECRIDFAPTYPWSEEPNCPKQFMNTRPPAWCDRVLFNKNALANLIQRDPNVEYVSLGNDQCIGDHKPVMLLFSLH